MLLLKQFWEFFYKKNIVNLTIKTRSFITTKSSKTLINLFRFQIKHVNYL